MFPLPSNEAVHPLPSCDCGPAHFGPKAYQCPTPIHIAGARSPISDKILVSMEEKEEEEAGGGDAMAVRMKPLFKK
jgi:hypothetical protein